MCASASSRISVSLLRSAVLLVAGVDCLPRCCVFSFPAVPFHVVLLSFLPVSIDCVRTVSASVLLVALSLCVVVCNVCDVSTKPIRRMVGCVVSISLSPLSNAFGAILHVYFTKIFLESSKSITVLCILQLLKQLFLRLCGDVVHFSASSLSVSIPTSQGLTSERFRPVTSAPYIVPHYLRLGICRIN